MDHHTETLGKEFVDLPLQCPDDVDIAKVLAKLLAFEDLVMTMANVTVIVSDGPDDPTVRKSRHEASFRHLAYDKKAFCKVDEMVLLDNVTSWQDVLYRLNQTWRGKESRIVGH